MPQACGVQEQVKHNKMRVQRHKQAKPDANSLPNSVEPALCR
jgi:hypothetical protein